MGETVLETVVCNAKSHPRYNELLEAVLRLCESELWGDKEETAQLEILLNEIVVIPGRRLLVGRAPLELKLVHSM